MLSTSLFASAANALEYQVKTFDGVKHIYVTGTYESGDSDKFEEFIDDKDDIEWVAFNSRGGNGYEGRRIGDIMADYLMYSRVRQDDICMSACADSFIGGIGYSVEGKLGFHSHSYSDYSGDGRIRVNKKDIQSRIYSSQLSTSVDIYHIMRHGFSWDLHYDYATMKGEFLELTLEGLKGYLSLIHI